MDSHGIVNDILIEHLIPRQFGKVLLVVARLLKGWEFCQWLKRFCDSHQPVAGEAKIVKVAKNESCVNAVGVILSSQRNSLSKSSQLAKLPAEVPQ